MSLQMMKIENATTQDLPALLEIFLEYEEQEHNIANSHFIHQGLNPLPLEICEESELLEFENLIGDPGKKILVAKSDDAVLGYATGWIRGDDFYDESRKKGLISTVAVRSECRNQGIGSKLCDSMEAWLQAQGCVSIDIQCFFRNEGAKRLYRRRGYSEIMLFMNKSLHEK